jgi:acylphosphatase
MGSESAVRVLVAGHVQGVGFRYFARHRAQALGLRGYVRNLADGRVEVVAVGPPDDVQTLVEQVRTGPPASRVRECLVERLDTVVPYSGFSID